MKKVLILAVILLVVVLVLAGCSQQAAPASTAAPKTSAPAASSSQPAPAAKIIEWKMISGQDKTDPMVPNYILYFANAVNDKAAGRLKINYVGGPESVPAMEQMKPLREGVFQILGTTAAYYAGELPLGQALHIIPNPSSEMRAAGLMSLLDEIHQKKLNVKFLSGFSSGVGYNFVLKKKIDKADFSGMKIRASSFYNPLIKALGGVSVTLPFPDIYGALDKGVVDATAWPSTGILDAKWYEVAKYILRPTYGSVSVVIDVNMDAWNALPKDLQDLLQKTAIDAENSQRAKLVEILKSEEVELQKKGMEIDQLPDAEAAKFLKTFDDKTWEELILNTDKDYGPQLRAIAQKLLNK
jgi:TRAP-type transport system periplasmic protein